MMQKGIDLVQLAQRIQTNRALKRDYVADTRGITMQIQRDQDTKRPVLEVANGGNIMGTFPVLPIAHDQIGGRTNIPAKYYDRMLAHAPDLLATNVNAWFRLNPERRMVRTLGGGARAFLSDKYKRIENEEIAEVALPILHDIPDVQIKSCEVTERRMYIQAVFPRIQGEVKRGDVVQAGVIISNSEVGLGSVSIAAMDYRLVCLNGMISSERFRAYHVGRRVEGGDDDNGIFADDTKRADDRAVLLKVRDMVTAAGNEARFRSRIEKAQALAEGRIIGHVVQAVEVLAQKLPINDSDKPGILDALIKSGDMSAWGILNAVTEQAHSPSISYDRAVEFEAMGGQLLDLPKAAWRQILEATEAQ
jgi:hypothetical protein